MEINTESENERTWDHATGVPGLVRDLKSGRYYSRMQVGGRRSMQTLKTKTWSVAKPRHADRIAGAERQRQSRRRLEGGGSLLGDLLDKHRNDYLADTARAKRSKENATSTHRRPEHHWKQCFGADLWRIIFVPFSIPSNCPVK